MSLPGATYALFRFDAKDCALPGERVYSGVYMRHTPALTKRYQEDEHEHR
jgi:hypothetical protein